MGVSHPGLQHLRTRSANRPEGADARAAVAALGVDWPSSPRWTSIGRRRRAERPLAGAGRPISARLWVVTAGTFAPLFPGREESARRGRQQRRPGGRGRGGWGGSDLGGRGGGGSSFGRGGGGSGDRGSGSGGALSPKLCPPTTGGSLPAAAAAACRGHTNGSVADALGAASSVVALLGLGAILRTALRRRPRGRVGRGGGSDARRAAALTLPAVAARVAADGATPSRRPRLRLQRQRQQKRRGARGRRPRCAGETRGAAAPTTKADGGGGDGGVGGCVAPVGPPPAVVVAAVAIAAAGAEIAAADVAAAAASHPAAASSGRWWPASPA
ncbi:hypothetical protein I4F81_010418 [Pyropia yezoensis]|uniref:Uncharacterized protein n=1 Tax=Pyropia yezoensis TaxID=2788 RepID=A0ACC3CDS0_PYRYE|nr:hypothetical protein I4F81_010418 [Neopyropia yezoensis]